MTRGPIVIEANASADEAEALLKTYRVTGLPVVGNGELDVVISHAATVHLAAREMIQRHIHRLVVIDDDGGPVGVVTPLDLLRLLVDAPSPSAA